MKILFFLVLPFVVGVSCQQAQLNAVGEANLKLATDTYSQLVKDAVDDIVTETDNIKILQAEIDKLNKVYGSELFNDRFYPSLSKFFYASNIVKKLGFTTFLDINEVAVREQESLGNGYLQECISKDLSKEITQFIAAAQQKIDKVTNQEAAFKKAIDSMCRLPVVIKSGKTKECADSLMQSNPIKVINSGEQTVYFINKLYKCLQYASDQVEIVGENGLRNIRTLTPTDLLYLLPKIFRVNFQTNIEFPPASSVALPTQVVQMLNATKASLKLTKDVLAEAKQIKKMSFEEAVNSLQPLLKDLQKFTEQSESVATTQEQACYTNTKNFIHIGSKATANNLLKCIADSELPSDTAFATLEKSVKERALAEKFLRPVLECAVQPTFAFSPDELQNCLKAGVENYITFLKTADLEIDLFYTDGTNFVRRAKRCICDANVEISRAARDELLTLSSCITSNSKVRLIRPQVPCVYNSCSS